MARRILVAIVLVLSALLVLAACGSYEHAALRAARLALTPAARTATPAFSLLQTPTPYPTFEGPLGTLTAIADLVASPTQNAEPYVLANRGKPHFIEFHAWW